MATPAQQSYPATALSMLVKKTNPIAYYIELSSLVRSVPKHNVLVIGGDMNAQIGKNVNNKFSLHNLSNRNFTLENRLTSLNTKFQKKKEKLWTYTYANNGKAQIDYILMNKKWKAWQNCLQTTFGVKQWYLAISMNKNF